MAEYNQKMSTCPICGYTDTAEDSDALHMAIVEHVRMAHNLDAAIFGGTADSVKPVPVDMAASVGGANTTGPAIPIIAAAPNSGASGADGAGVGYGPVAGVIGAQVLDDNDDNNTKANT